jgi:hypothetical protein
VAAADGRAAAPGAVCDARCARRQVVGGAAREWRGDARPRQAEAAAYTQEDHMTPADAAV